MGDRGGIHTHDRWEFTLPAPAHAEPEEKLEELIAALEVVAPGVRCAAEQFSAGVGFVVYTEEANPGFHVSAEMVQRLGALQLSLDLDIYTLGVE